MAIEFVLFLLIVVPAFWAAVYALIKSERLAKLIAQIF